MSSFKSSSTSYVPALLTVLLLAAAVSSVHGCSCMNPGDTGAERASTIKSNEYTNLVVIATFEDETSWTEDDHGFPTDYQNTTFTVQEIVYQRDSDSSLENYLEVQDDGTMLVHKTTVTTCCLCGQEMKADDIGSDYLLEISEYGDSFSTCSASCRYTDSRSDLPEWELDREELCHDTADELRESSNTKQKNMPKLEGAKASAFDDRYALNDNQEDVFVTSSTEEDASITAGDAYTYKLYINTTLNLEMSGDGSPVIDGCVSWPDDTSPSNFTWYGLRIQLDEDATTGSGGYYTNIVRATKELGFVQEYNTTTSPLDYEIKTNHAQPTIRINYNDKPFWQTFKFDFVNKQGSSAVSDGDDYQEFNITMDGTVRCSASDGGWSNLRPVIPTMTVSLQRLSGGAGGNTPPGPPSAAAGVSGKWLHKGMLFTVLAVLASVIV